MSTEIFGNKKYSVVRFWGGKEIMYQITQRYKTSVKREDWTRNNYGYVCLTKRQLKTILKKIESMENE